jgi:hypothetical protein
MLQRRPPVSTIPTIKSSTALRTTARAVLVSLERSPFADFTAEEFNGQKLLNCNGTDGCVSGFKGSALTIGQMADTRVYYGGENADGENKVKQTR